MTKMEGGENMKKYIYAAIVVAMLAATPASAGYMAGDECANMPVGWIDKVMAVYGVTKQAVIDYIHTVCPDRSFGWQDREYFGQNAPEASGGGPGGDAGGSASSGGD
jgi:hypothetical protein